MRVAYITRTLYGVLGGGASYFFPHKLSQLTEVLVISPSPAKSSEQVTMSSVAVKVCSVPGGGGEEVLYQVYRLLAEFKPDIVHVFHSPNCLLYAVRLKQIFPTAKWVLDFRSPPIIPHWRDRLKTRFRYFACQFFYDQIFTHSIRTTRQNLPVRLKRVREMIPGVELSSIGHRQAPRNNTPQRFVYVGSVTASRRLDLLVDAFIIWAAKINHSVRLEIYGAGNALDDLRQRVRLAAAEHCVVFHGAVEQHELLKRLPEFDVGVAYVPYDMFARAPSLKSLEYAAAGLSILASDTVGHKDYAKRFGFRFNFFSNDTASIVAALDHMYNNFYTLSDVAANLESVKIFDWSAIVRHQLLPAYKEIISHD